MVIRISDKTQNYSKVTKLLVKPFEFTSDTDLNPARLLEISFKFEIKLLETFTIGIIYIISKCPYNIINPITNMKINWKVAAIQLAQFPVKDIAIFTFLCLYSIFSIHSFPLSTNCFRTPKSNMISKFWNISFNYELYIPE